LANSYSINSGAMIKKNTSWKPAARTIGHPEESNFIIEYVSFSSKLSVQLA
jgi:hypothetical protein